MRILHTSDWHVGRTFHGHSTLAALGEVLGALAGIVRERAVDVVVVAGDIFDSSVPSRDSYAVLGAALAAIREAGATIILTSGNHDSATRLGFQSEFAAFGGVHVLTRPEQHSTPVTLRDEHGEVQFYGIPYLEPALVRGLYPEVELRSHAQVLDFAMGNIRADHAARGGRSVVAAHCFAVNVGVQDAVATASASPLATELNAEPAAHGATSQPAASQPADTQPVAAQPTAAAQPAATQPTAAQPAAGDDAAVSDDVVRDITAGGLDLVPLSTFDGPDYVALGHIHGRATLSERARYSGAPLHYSFSEAGKPRGAWLVELDAAGLGGVEWVDLPIVRSLSILSGTLDELLTDAAFADAENDWVFAVLTDQSRPMDAMRKLQTRFAWCATLQHRPSVVAEISAASYAERIRHASDPEIVDSFLALVRNGDGASEAESEIIAGVIANHEAVRSGEVPRGVSVESDRAAAGSTRATGSVASDSSERGGAA